MAILISLLAQRLNTADDLSWQIGIAAFALAVGIPHGALDHLVTLPKGNPKKMAFFIAIYVSVAVAAVFAILQWNVVGFQLVVLMSLVHFGIGDSAFITELDRLSESKVKKFPTLFVALPLGALPVVIPLINGKSTSALESVNSSLVNWHQDYQNQLATVVIVLSIIATVALIYTKRFRDLTDLFLLAALAVLTPPLIAFAVYFGCWHAMRHTARLTLVLPASIKSFQNNDAKKAFLSAVIPGLPALFGSFAIAGVFWWQQSLDNSFFWFALVIVWALTVPHMMVTAKLDRKALAQ
jgi:Brp/Blh family beta-carotene 15,15'-monooxygenase